MDDSPERGDAIFIANAGIVLLAPYLPRLFERLNLLTVDHAGNQKITGTGDLSRGVRLLQYLVDERMNATEPELVLNKLLCGATGADSLLASVTTNSADLELCDELLHAVVDNWPVLSGTSLAGLRETFLQREGRLNYADDGWRLQVQRSAVDVLVDQIPWNFSTVFHGWMARPIQVTW